MRTGAPRPTPEGLPPALAAVVNSCRALLAVRDESSIASLAVGVVRRYHRLGDDERARFFTFLLEDLDADPAAVKQAIEQYERDPGPEAVQGLLDAADTERRRLLEHLNEAPDGAATLLLVRAHLLDALRDRPALVPVEADLARLLRSWFNPGFLSLEQIDWNTPAAVLERLIAYEAVHQIRGWDDLRRRLERDRRCYAFFHPSLPGEPLIFVEVALTAGLPSSIHALLDEPPPVDPAPPVDAAIFYSITNCQRGLAGIPLGNLLIKRVAARIHAELESVTCFATLSPVPGFGPWLAETRRRRAPTLDPGDLEILQAIDEPGWHASPAASALQPVLTKLCARFLLEVRRGREVRDPVARFHLRNGARLERINWLADTSDKGLTESTGMMVNYVYDPEQIAANHERYVNERAVIASPEVRRLAARTSPGAP